MNLLIDARSLVEPSPGGVGRVARSLVSAYATIFPEDRITCVTTGQNRPELPKELNDAENVTHAHLRLPNKLWSSLSLLDLVSLDRTTKHLRGPIDTTFLPNLGFVGHLSKPYTLLLHDLSFLIEPRWFKPKTRLWHRAVRAKRLIQCADRLLTVSKTTKRDAMRLLNIPEERIHIIPIGPSLSSFSETDATSPFPVRRYVFALGAGDPRKNIRTAIESVQVLRQEAGFEDVHLVIAGTPSLDASPTEARAQPWLHFIPRPDDIVLSNLYSHASVFLYPSWYEGYGLPLHEAARFSTPTIASTAGALPETSPPKTIFANPAKPHHWVAAMKIALSSPRSTPFLPQTTWEPAAKILRESLTESLK